MAQVGDELPPESDDAENGMVRRFARSVARSAGVPSWQLLLPVLGVALGVPTILLLHKPWTEVELDVTASRLSFVASHDEALCEPIRVAAIGIPGVRRITLTSADGEQETYQTPDDELGRALVAVDASSDDGGGTISLDEVAVPARTRITVGRLGPATRYRMTFEVPPGARPSLSGSLGGRIRAQLPGMAPARRVFARPERIDFEWDREPIELEVTLPDAGRLSFRPRLRAEALELSEIDESPSEVRQLSTLLSGSVHLRELGSREHTLRRWDDLRFRRSIGEFRTLELGPEAVTFEFLGTVGGMTSNGNRSLMPTWFEWFDAQDTLWRFWGTAAYVLSVAAGGVRWWRTRVVGLGLVCVAATLGVARAASPGLDDTMRLVVMVHVQAGDDDVFGSGIVFGTEDDRLFIVTANHVPRGRENADLSTLRVYFRVRPGERVPAKLLDQFSPRLGGLDVAVLAVEGLAEHHIDVGSLAFDRLGDSTALKRDDAVYALGNPGGADSWSISPNPDKFAERAERRIKFESPFIKPGHSGGALLNERYEIVGMIRDDESPYGVAVDIDPLLDTLRGWGYPVMLQHRFATTDLQRISAGGSQTCWIGPGGAARCWGFNTYGQVGDGSYTDATSPALVDGGFSFVSISAGNSLTCGVTNTGAAYCWGNDDGEPVGERPKIFSPVPVPVSGGLKFKAVSAGNEYACGIATDGRAYCWGNAEGGELGNGSVEPTEGGALGNAKLRPGAGPVAVIGNLRFTSVSTGAGHACALTADGAAYCWGDNAGGALGDGTTTTRPSPVRVKGGLHFTSVSAGDGFTCAVADGGAGYCWGANLVGRLGTAKPMQIATEPVRIAGNRSFRMIDAGSMHACGVTVDRTAYCWGDNEAGALGSEEYERTNEPEAVVGGLSFESVSAGHFHTCGLATDGSIHCWGANKYGQLGRPASEHVTSRPARVSLP